MTAVFLNARGCAAVNQTDLERLISMAQKDPLKRARFCLHPDHGATVQEMIIVLCDDSIVPIHRHRKKSESFHIIQGVLEFQVYDQEKKIAQKIVLGDLASKYPFYYRQEKDVWHTVKPLSPFVIFHEVTTGPFVPGDTEILALDG